MKKVFILFFLAMTCVIVTAQSKSIERFRKLHKEDQNVFFYSSTIKMLNNENEPEFADLIKDIDKVMVLLYEKEKQKFNTQDIIELKNNLQKEKYVPLLIINENNNTINLYKRDRKEKTVGFSAIVDNKESLVIIDVKGSIDFKKFMEFKNKIDLKL
jgi:hypothetical protein